MPYVRKDPSREPIPGALDCHDCYPRFRVENPGPDAHTGTTAPTPAAGCTRISCAAGSAGVPPALLSWSGRPKRRMKRLTDIAYWEESWWKDKRPERLRLYRDVDFEVVRLLGGISSTVRTRTYLTLRITKTREPSILCLANDLRKGINRKRRKPNWVAQMSGASATCTSLGCLKNLAHRSRPYDRYSDAWEGYVP